MKYRWALLARAKGVDPFAHAIRRKETSSNPAALSFCDTYGRPIREVDGESTNQLCADCLWAVTPVEE